jgi:NADPH-dependent 2,4-dienoyl-CoA reductase/sulfur reductase-like enzyme
VAGSEEDYPADLVLLAMGFTGPERSPMLAQFGVDLNERGASGRDDWRTNVDGVFVAGDMGRGQSLIVWAIAEGRAAAAAVDRHLMGDSLLPSPIVRPPPRSGRGGPVPVIVVGADTAVGRRSSMPSIEPDREIRAFVTDVGAAEELRQMGSRWPSAMSPMPPTSPAPPCAASARCS